jgi:hypothetical protein
MAPATEANKANIHRFVDEALNHGILDVVDETRGEFAEHSKARFVRGGRRSRTSTQPSRL